jgi:hypothetical protein
VQWHSRKGPARRQEKIGQGKSQGLWPTRLYIRHFHDIQWVRDERVPIPPPNLKSRQTSTGEGVLTGPKVEVRAHDTRTTASRSTGGEGGNGPGFVAKLGRARWAAP